MGLKDVGRLCVLLVSLVRLLGGFQIKPLRRHWRGKSFLFATRPSLTRGPSEQVLLGSEWPGLCPHTQGASSWWLFLSWYLSLDLLFRHCQAHTPEFPELGPLPLTQPQLLKEPGPGAPAREWGHSGRPMCRTTTHGRRCSQHQDPTDRRTGTCERREEREGCGSVPLTHTQAHTHAHMWTRPPTRTPSHLRTCTQGHSRPQARTCGHTVPRLPPPGTSRSGSEPHPGQETSTRRWRRLAQAWGWEEWGWVKDMTDSGRRTSRTSKLGKEQGAVWLRPGAGEHGEKGRRGGGWGAERPEAIPDAPALGAGPQAGQGPVPSLSRSCRPPSARTESHPGEKTAQLKGLGPQGSRESGACGYQAGTQIPPWVLKQEASGLRHRAASWPASRPVGTTAARITAGPRSAPSPAGAAPGKPPGPSGSLGTPVVAFTISLLDPLSGTKAGGFVRCRGSW